MLGVVYMDTVEAICTPRKLAKEAKKRSIDVEFLVLDLLAKRLKLDLRGAELHT